MSLTSSGPHILRQPHSSPTNQRAESVTRLQQRLFTAVDAAVSADTIIASCLQILRETFQPAAIVYYRRRHGTSQVISTPELSPPGMGNVQGVFQQLLDDCCSAAAESDRVVTK